jgi:hypothetical protein
LTVRGQSASRRVAVTEEEATMHKTMTMVIWGAALGLVLGGCDPVDDDDTTGDDDTSDDDDTADDDDSTADDDDSIDDDDDTTGRQGLRGYSGEATVDLASFQGTEELYFVGDEGFGATICRIRYDLIATAVREDCDGCSWAFDVQTSGAGILEESDVGCEGSVGISAATVGTLDGQTLSYGYYIEYMGHADVLMIDNGSGFAAAAYADWDEGSGHFSYDREDGLYPY